MLYIFIFDVIDLYVNCLLSLTPINSKPVPTTQPGHNDNFGLRENPYNVNLDAKQLKKLRFKFSVKHNITNVAKTVKTHNVVYKQFAINGRLGK